MTTNKLFYNDKFFVNNCLSMFGENRDPFVGVEKHTGALLFGGEYE